MSWTEERVAILKKLWGEGKTAAEIAKELGNTTRNAVIGKAHRLNLSSRVSPIQQNKKSSKKKKSKSKSKSKSSSAKKTRTKKKKTAVQKDKEELVAMSDLTHSTCRWPYGDPQKDDFGFCGDAPYSGMPYCQEHAQEAYKTSTRKKKKKKSTGRKKSSVKKAANA